MKSYVAFGVALALLAGCDTGPHPIVPGPRPDAAAGTGGGTGGGSGGGGGSRPDAAGSGGSGGSVGSGGSGGRGGTGGSGGSGGTGGTGGTGGSGGRVDGGQDAPLFDAPGSGGSGGAPPPDAAADSPMADAADAAADVPADAPASDAPSSDVADAPAVSDTKIPDGGFQYPNPDGRLCGNSKHTLGKTAAEIMIVLDRSGSMSAFTTAPRTRWDDARDAVYDAVLANQNFAWGLKLFPAGPGACTINPNVEVPVAFGSGPALQAAIDPAGPPFGPLGNGTPTDIAVNAATTYLKTVTRALPKYLLLVTDGAPTCMNNGPGTRNEANTLAAIQSAAMAGFKTYVIGIATEVMDIDTLNRMADVGGTARAGATRYYPAGSRAELGAAIQAITQAVTTCVFPLVTMPPEPDFVGVTAGNMPIPRDVFQAQGWDYTMNGTAIQIHGTTCDDLKSGRTLNVNVYFGCPN